MAILLIVVPHYSGKPCLGQFFTPANQIKTPKRPYLQLQPKKPSCCDDLKVEDDLDLVLGNLGS